ncbi:MAG: ABC transporter ATP-binding protein [Planctomycetota bacterium]|jgi:ATP-binding cassette subfamily B protein
MFRRWALLLRYLPPYKRAIAGGITALICANALGVLAPVAIKRAINAIEGETVDREGVLRWALVAVGITAISALAAFFKRFLLMRTSRRAETDLRHDLFAHIQRLPIPYFDRTRTGDLMSRATADVEAARLAIGPAFMYLMDSILRFGFALAVLLSHNPVLTAYALVPLLGICAGLFYFAPRIHKTSRVVQDQLAAISARSQESFAGGRVVKTFATEDREAATMNALGQDYVNANLALARIRGATTAWLGLMGAAGMVAIIYVGGRQVIEGTFDIGGLIMFTSLQVMLIWPMMAFGWVLSMVQRGAAGMDRIVEVFAVAEEADTAGTDAELKGAIEFRGLDFAYNPERDGAPVLHDIALEIPAGSTLGIAGPTGSGKSTLVSLLPRLYDPPRGTLRIDGIDVLDIPLRSLRRSIAIVPQEAFLFSTTIRDNIGFGRPGADDDWIAQAALDAHLQNDVGDFEMGMETVVGERGVTLSGGQKQRAALARAIATDAPVLVLDDALSAVDTETETTILDNLRRVGAGRTVIVVAHRVSALRHADHIVYLRDGAVVEQGTHDELVARGGEYAQLARAQEIEEELEGMDA